MFVPDHTTNPKGGRLPIDKQRALAAIVWVLDNCSKGKDLSEHFGSKGRAHL
jgi:hypothetical protein